MLKKKKCSLPYPILSGYDVSSALNISNVYNISSENFQLIFITRKKIILPIKEQIQRSVSSENHQHWRLQALSMIPMNNCSYLQLFASMHTKCMLLVHQKKKTWYCKEWTDTTEVVKGFQMLCLENIWQHLLLLELYEDHKLKTKKVSMLSYSVRLVVFLLGNALFSCLTVHQYMKREAVFSIIK